MIPPQKVTLIFINTKNLAGLKILNFETATEEWLDFVYENRFSDKLIHKYDIVKGPVADDDLFQTLRLYERKILDREDTIKRLKTYKLINQISFHTKEALSCITYIETKEIKYYGKK